MRRQYNFESDIKFMTGRGALRNATVALSNMGARRVMLICDEGSVKHGKLKSLLRQIGKELNIICQYKKVLEDATSEDCDRALRLFKEKDCDSIIALGQRSAIYVAKAVKIMLKDGVSFMSNYLDCAVNNISSKPIPLTVIPTYLSSGIEASNSVRIKCEDKRIIQLDTPFAQTNFLVLDPCLCSIIGRKSIASTGLNALAMAIKSLTSHSNIDPMTKVYALDAITLLTDNFEQCLMYSGIRKYRFNVAFATTLAGCAYWSSPNALLTELRDIICDHSGADYRDVFNILFAKGVEKIDFKCDFDTYALVNLIGYNQYVEVHDGKNSGQIVRESVKNYYAKLKKYVKYPLTFKDLGIDDDTLSEAYDQFTKDGNAEKIDYANKLLKDEINNG
ncbi:MAG: iron-containing alcohol dehydrogenase [Clostridia bacterium]|nr:iron-containing alcohol dehydrogenase [Clostridia bacterium]